MNEKISCNLDEINTEELHELQAKIDNVLAVRRRKAKEKAWNEVVEAIKNYCSSYGSIEYHICGDEYYINDSDDFSTLGEILPQD